ncbi:MAG: hypothetical protein LBB83_10935 [Treponema sp.]|jgi:hypothetical protein|nr:hypothetical protein [Treponema sp.]
MKRYGYFFGFTVLLFALIVNGTVAAQTLASLEGSWQGASQRLVFTGSRMFMGEVYGEDGEFDFVEVRQVTNREIFILADYDFEEDEVMYYRLRGNVLFLYLTEENYKAETEMLVFARIANVGKSPLEGVWEGDDAKFEFTGNMIIVDETAAFEFSYTDEQIQFAGENWDYHISGETLLLVIPDEGRYFFTKK